MVRHHGALQLYERLRGAGALRQREPAEQYLRRAGPEQSAAGLQREPAGHRGQLRVRAAAVRRRVVRGAAREPDLGGRLHVGEGQAVEFVLPTGLPWLRNE